MVGLISHVKHFVQIEFYYFSKVRVCLTSGSARPQKDKLQVHFFCGGVLQNSLLSWLPLGAVLWAMGLWLVSELRMGLLLENENCLSCILTSFIHSWCKAFGHHSIHIIIAKNRPTMFLLSSGLVNVGTWRTFDWEKQKHLQ